MDNVPPNDRVDDMVAMGRIAAYYEQNEEITRRR